MKKDSIMKTTGNGREMKKLASKLNLSVSEPT
jgi:hypothetical protein